MGCRGSKIVPYVTVDKLLGGEWLYEAVAKFRATSNGEEGQMHLSQEHYSTNVLWQNTI